MRSLLAQHGAMVLGERSRVTKIVGQVYNLEDSSPRQTGASRFRRICCGESAPPAFASGPTANVPRGALFQFTVPAAPNITP